MRLGLFKRVGTEAGVFWLLGPLAAVALVYFPCRIYCDRQQRALDERQAVLQLIPKLNQQVALARQTLREFPLVPASSADASAEFTALLNAAAREHGFAVKSTTITKGAPEKPGISSFTIVLQGEGTLTSVVTFLHALEDSKQIFGVDRASLSLSALADGAAYGGEIVLQCHALSPAS